MSLLSQTEHQTFADIENMLLQQFGYQTALPVLARLKDCPVLVDGARSLPHQHQVYAQIAVDIDRAFR
jgi:hypothetical protein